MNPNDEIQRERLFKAMESSYRALEPFRNLNRGLVEEYAGSGYGPAERARHEKLLNLAHQAADAYQMGLAANRPRVILSTPDPRFKYFAKQFQLAINSLAEEIALENTFRAWVLDALFCVGLVKVHMADSGPVQLEQGWLMDPGKPFASNVSLDNWCHDMNAATWDQVRFAADSYRIPFEDLQHSGIYDPAAIQDLQPTSKYPVEGERLEAISRGTSTDQDELEPMIDVVDVWTPRSNLITTYALQSRDRFVAKGKPLAVMEWNGPETGNYHWLGFNDVPGNIMPSSPFMHVSSIERLINNIMRKQAKRAKSQKRTHIYTPAGKQGAANIQASSDDEWREVQDVSQIGMVETGGIDGNMHGFMQSCMELFDRMCGNLPAMMGLGAQAETLGQEQLIHGAVSKKEAKMQFRVFDGARKLMRDLGFLLWEDQVKTIPGRLPIEGAETYTVDATWTPEDREGNFLDYKFDIDVFSMSYQSPAQRLNTLNTLLAQIYLPAMPLMSQQGLMIDFAKVVETHAELLNEPRIKEWIKSIAVQPPEEGSAGGEAPGKPAVTTRNTVRRNVPTGGTMDSRRHVEQQAWLASGGANPQQKAAMARPAG